MAVTCVYWKDIARKKIILDQEGGLLVNGTTSAVVVDEGGELLVYPGGEASNCEINQGGVFYAGGGKPMIRCLLVAP